MGSYVGARPLLSCLAIAWHLLGARGATLSPAGGPAAGPAAGLLPPAAAQPGCQMAYKQTLTPTRPLAGFGERDMAVSGDGQVVLLSGDKEQAAQGRPATVYLATYSATLQAFGSLPQTLRDPQPNSGRSFGASLAASPDASCLVVGSSGGVPPGASTAVSGLASMYRLPALPGAGVPGYQLADGIKLQPPNTTSSSAPGFGAGGLTISASCDMVVVGEPAPSQPTAALRQLYGSAGVHIFTQSDQASGGNITFGLAQTLPAPDGAANQRFGQKVLLSKDASVLVVSDPLLEQTNLQGVTYTAGAVYVFRQQGGPGNRTYSLSQSIYGRNNTVSGYAADMGLSEDGQLLVVGEPEAEVVRVYAAGGPGQPFQLALNVTAPEAAPRPSRLGQRLALSGDGTLALLYVSAPGNGSHPVTSLLRPYHLARGLGTGGLSAGASDFLQGALPASAQCADAETCTSFGRVFALSADGSYFVASGKSRSEPARHQAYVFKTSNCTVQGPAPS